SWIGVTDSGIYGGTEGIYKWVNGEALTYSNWTPGEPNNILHPWSPEGENFGEMYALDSWNDSTGVDPSTVDPNRQPQRGIIEIDPASLTQPIVNLHVTDTQAGEDGNAGQILIQRIGKLDEDLTVNYTVAGSATNGVDYQQLTGTATIAAGSSLVTIPIYALADDELGENERITVNLAPGDYEVGTKPVAEILVVDQHPINRVSNEVIGRNVDVPYWTQRWRNGETLEQLRIAIIEAANDGQGNYEAETKIKEIYQDVLGREAEDTEVANWRSRLEAGATLSQVHQELQGQEFIPTLNYVYTNPANGHRYVLTTPDTWLGAQEQAKALGGNLVSINDGNENQW
ncbi:MAG: Calx-beta domain-containing protein, partial [Cyanobacteriota bacterium]